MRAICLVQIGARWGQKVEYRMLDLLSLWTV